MTKLSGTRKIAIPVVLALFAGTACWPFSNGDQLAEMTLKRLSGHVRILRASDTISVSDKEPLQARDVVETLGHSSARLRLVGDRTVMLAPNSQVRITTTHSIQVANTGSVLADISEPMQLTFSGIEAQASHAQVRIDQGSSSSRAASYSGAVRLFSPGQPRVTVPPLFQVASAASALRAAQPYRLNDNDPWDATYLKDVVSLDQSLTPLITGLQRQLGRSRPNLAYFQALAGNKDVSAVSHYLQRKTSDLLTAFEIALRAKSLPFKTALRRAFHLFDSGARWAVVAAIMRVQFHTLLASLQDVVLGTGAVAGGSGQAPAFTVAAANSARSGKTGSAAGPPATGPGPGGDNPPADDGNTGDGGGGGNPRPEPSPTACNNIGCSVPSIFPGPSPSGILNDVLSQ
ncbi:MAG: hypothetical protein M3290_10440 [Actinomycetota bacterium]|nr:hypothetical protein [Actinomycetota bacterium]